MVTGGTSSFSGYSVELLNSDGSWYCNLPSFQEPRSTHSQIGNLVCGGGNNKLNTTLTCEVFNSGIINKYFVPLALHNILGQWFQLKTELIDRRFAANIFENENGVILMAGEYSNSAEILQNGESHLLDLNISSTRYFEH